MSYYIPWAAWLVWCAVVSLYMIKDVLYCTPGINYETAIAGSHVG
ncbi:hypothetical protein PS928_04244 [Pseudomonas fluorescens]|uniref:Uncharacterized protein n=1 Tax=Pseudomonas fluorescens TaxID=294 RepID=A0A5E7UUN5_PSEFL|nr:hypothetical protein PS928_04244 [Pseudomonas fluorescens]